LFHRLLLSFVLDYPNAPMSLWRFNNRMTWKMVAVSFLAATFAFCLFQFAARSRAANAGSHLSSANSTSKSSSNFLAAPAGMTYTWNPPVPAIADWTIPTNWTPTRLTPAANDVLVINTGFTPTLTNVPSQTIGVLMVSNNTAAKLQAGANGNALTISGATGSDLQIDAGSSMTFDGSNALKISVASGSTGLINGSVILQGGAHRLLAADLNGITFGSGSNFTTSTGFTGNPFGTGSGGDGADQSVRFRDGSAAFFNSGSSPFGSSANGVASFTFASAETFFTPSAFSYDGRTYGTLILDGGQVYAGGASANNLIVGGELNIVSGSTLTLSDTAGGDLILFNDITVDGTLDTNGRTVKFQGGSLSGGTTQTIKTGATFGDVSISKLSGTVKLGGMLTINGALQFNGTSSAVDVLELNSKTLTLNGTIGGTSSSTANGIKGDLSGATLNINGTGALGTVRFVSGAQTLTTMTMTGSGSVTLGSNLTIGNASTGSLSLTNYILNTGGNTLSLSSFATLTRTNGYVVGNLQKSFAGATSFTFPVGSGSGSAYSPVDAANVTGTGSLTVKAVGTKQPNISGLNALSRYWTLSGSGITADLTFHYLVGDVVGTESSYKVFKYDGSFTQPLGQSPPNTIAHTVTVTGVSSFSDWTLAEGWQLQFSASSYSDPEQNSGTHPKTITVQRVGGTTGDVTVHWATSEGTATAGSDYDAASGDLTWLNGDGTDKSFDVPIHGDTTYEANETVIITLSGATGGTIGGTNPVTLTILNDDCPSSSTLTVNTIDDEDNGACLAAHCSLREAINAANCSTDATTINFDAIVFAAPGPYAISLASALPSLSTDMTINGPGANVLTVQRSTAGGTGQFRIFAINSGKTVNISGLSISNGHASDGAPGSDGGGILNSGALTLTNIAVNGNQAGDGVNAFGSANGGSGGGIFNSGTLMFTNSSASGNRSGSGLGGGFAGSGGAIMNTGTLTVTSSTISTNQTGSANTGDGIGGGIANSGGTLTIIDSTLSDNHTGSGGGFGGGNGGGLQVSSGTVNATNTTFSGNAARSVGGAISYQGGTSTLTNVTITNNRSDSDNSSGSDQGGGIFPGAGTVTLKNTIVAGNFRGTGTARDDISGAIDAASSFNLIGDGTNMIGIGNNNGNQIGSSGSPIDSMLAPLANNGGSTQTYLPLPASPAINAGDPAFVPPPASDQRGLPRVVGGRIDIGAVETNYTIAATAGSGQSAVINSGFATAMKATVKESGTNKSGIPVTFTAPSGATPSGTFPGSALIVTVNTDGSAVATAPTFTANGKAGTYNVVASIGSAPPTVGFALTNTPGGTSTNVSSSVNPSDFGESVTFTAIVTSTAGTPSGMVQFMDGMTNLGSPVCVAGGGNTCTAQFSISTLTSGTHTITASYSDPNTNFSSSSGTISGGQVVKPQPSLSINDVSIGEGDAGTKNFVFTVTLSAASHLQVKVDFATADGTATTTDSDYQSNSGPLTFSAGDTTKTITVLVNGDQKFEPNETFFVNLINPVNATITDNQGLGTILNDDAQGGIISFSQSNYAVSEAAGFVNVTVNRTGDTTRAATVDYATDDTGAPTSCSASNGLASSRCDFTTALGTLKFAANDTQKTFVVLVNRDSYAEIPNETFKVTLSNLTGGAVFATPSSATVTLSDSAPPATNAIDDADTFVRQHYHDFLNREADTSGLNFWKNELTSCGSNAQCIEVKRINVSVSFFLSIEFQQTGYLVERMYKVAYGDATGNSTFNGAHTLSVPIVRLNEFLTDTQRIGNGVVVLQPGWEQLLENNKQAYAQEFVQTSRFTSANAFPTTMTPDQFVDKLNQNAGNVLSSSERMTAINLFGGAGDTSNTTARAKAVRQVAEDPDLASAEFNRAFVLMQYLGYLRRNPNDPQDSDYTGYDFWLTKLNQFNGNYINAEMVKAFISSIEYRQRFGP
jgi:CSLREA domain-containing protein